MYKNYLMLGAAVCFGLGLTTALAADEPKQAPNPNEGMEFPARALPDRIVLTPGADPAHEMAVGYRTDAAAPAAEAELAPAIDGPSIGARAKPVSGTTISGPLGALYHHVVFSGLTPDTAYVYRVKGAGGFSEWFQFRTAQEGFHPFTFLYFGDTQNNILPIASRVIRQAFHATAAPALVLHGGDLVDQRNEKAGDDAWGEWFAAGGYNYAVVPEVPAAGNHEYTEKKLPGGGEEKGGIGPWWTANFVLPANGSDPVKATTYFVDYQGVRFVILDGTSATERGTLNQQVAWLTRVLSESKAHWNVVMFHQPLFMCARPDDLPEWKAAMQPVLEKYGADLVLSGHDHCYSRLTNPAGKSAARPAKLGPVYMVSVTGSKMYGLNNRAQTQPDRVAEDTELYQVVEAKVDRLAVRAYSATGKLYDSFDIVRGKDGSKHLDVTGALPPLRVCKDTIGPDGLPCTSRGK